MKVFTAVKLASALVAMTTVGSLGYAPAALADKIKVCEDEIVPVTGPPFGGFTQTETETQIAACGSNSDTGEVIEVGPVTNRGGGTPGGQQP
jgi:hypothetical protein